MSTFFFHFTSVFEKVSYVCRSIFAFVTVGLILYGVYYWLLPKPVPGIAYNLEATKSLFGDAPSMIKEVSVTGEFRVWCTKQVKKMDSPICQVFIRPFSKPWILLADFRESKDILMRRKEFDKSSFLSDGMACMGSFHGIYKTGDKFKSNRQLIQDLMTTSFLHNHVGPAIYGKGLDVMKLFEMKMDLANGRPFSIKKDFEHASLDIMLEFAFGKNWALTATGPQIELISKLSTSDVTSNSLDQPVDFPMVPIVDFLKSVHEAPEIVEKAINAIMPKLQTWWWSNQSWYKKVFDEKERIMKSQVAIALQNYRSGHVKTGIEHMLMREGARAEKEGRKPIFESEVFRDEVRTIDERCMQYILTTSIDVRRHRRRPSYNQRGDDVASQVPYRSTSDSKQAAFGTVCNIVKCERGKSALHFRRDPPRKNSLLGRGN